MRNSDCKPIGWTVTLACVLSLGLMSPGLVESQGQNKVDVCHVEGNGSYILINIAEPAFQAHIDHGDAVPGDEVPGSPSAFFDEACIPVAVTPVCTGPDPEGARVKVTCVCTDDNEESRASSPVEGYAACVSACISAELGPLVSCELSEIIND